MRRAINTVFYCIIPHRLFANTTKYVIKQQRLLFNIQAKSLNMSIPNSNRDQKPQSPSQPPYGKRLIPQIVDDLARSDPNRLYASFPLSTNLSDGFRDVSFRELARAADATAWWLEKQIGRSDSTDTIAYMGISDIRYAIIFLAGVKCGYKVILTPPY